MNALLIQRTAKGIGPGKTESPNLTVAAGETTVGYALDPNVGEWDDPALLTTVTIERFDETKGDFVIVSQDSYPGGFRTKGGGFPASSVTYPAKTSPQNWRVSVTTNKALSVSVNGETK